MLHKNLLGYGKFMFGGHFDFVRHFAPFFFTSYERSLYEVLIYDLVILNFFYGFLSKKNRFLRKKKSVALPSAVISWLSI
jgi:hypothetical protein